ncbi:MAG: cell envelope integrity protein TolA [Pirellulaceae bacterium]
MDILEQVSAAQRFAAERTAREKAERQVARRLEQERRSKARAELRRLAEQARREQEQLAEEAKSVQVEAVPPVEAEADRGQRANNRMTWRIGGTVTAIVATVLSIYVITRGSDLRGKLDRCNSKDVVSVRVMYSGISGTETVVFDFRDGGSPSARRIDPVHLLMQFANELDLYSVRRVVLARNGQHRFYISSVDLRPLADSYAGGGVLWAFNNLPANVRRMDGTRAFGEWTGGLLGVLKEQAEDVNQFIDEWIGDSSVGGSYMTQPDDDSMIRSRVRQTLQEMEDNVPQTLQEMEGNLPDTMADMEARMMKDAAKYGLSPSDVRSQLRDIEAGARKHIRGMEDDVRAHIRGLEDEVVDSLRKSRRQ